MALYEVTLFLTDDDLQRCKQELKEVESIVGKDGVLVRTLNEGFSEAEKIDDEISDEVDAGLHFVRIPPKDSTH